MNDLLWFIDPFERIHMSPHILRYFNKTFFVTGFVFRKCNVHVWDSIIFSFSIQRNDSRNVPMIS